MRHAALPAPGSEAQLLEMAARIASQPLDRTKPLWEFWLVEGIEPAAGVDAERFAMIFKTHHALVDGISGVDLATVLFDFSPSPPPLETDGLEPWQPQPEPSAARAAGGQRARRGGRGRRAGPADALSAVDASRSAALQALRDAAEGVGEIVWAALNPAPETPLNVPIGPHRRFRVVRQQLADYKTVKDSLGGTVNDVVLTVVAGALGDWLRSRGDPRPRARDARAGAGLGPHRGPAAHARQPADGDARAAAGLHRGSGRAAAGGQQRDGRAEESKQAVGAATLVAVNDIAPPTVLAQASRLQFSTRLFNLLVTNIPGPQVPLYILGRKLQDLFPLAFLPGGHALAVAIMSYNGAIEYGLLGDFDAMPDIDVIADGIDADVAAIAVRMRAWACTRACRRRGGRAGQVAAAGHGARTVHRTRAVHRARAGPGSAAGGAAATPLLPTSRRRPAAGPAADMRAKRNQRRGTRRPPKESGRTCGAK